MLMPSGSCNKTFEPLIPGAYFFLLNSGWVRGYTVSLKAKFKRHMPGEFHDCSWVFWSRHCSHKGARRVEERKKEENEDDETRFSPFSG